MDFRKLRRSFHVLFEPNETELQIDVARLNRLARVPIEGVQVYFIHLINAEDVTYMVIKSDEIAIQTKDRDEVHKYITDETRALRQAQEGL